VHYARDILEEVFGRDNFVAQITFLKTSGSTREYIASTADYLLLFARDKSALKYRPVFREKSLASEAGGPYSWLELSDGTRRRMTTAERHDPSALPEDARVFRIDNLQSQSVGREKGEGAACWFPVEFSGREWRPDAKSRWKTNEEGMQRLRFAKRLAATSGGLYYVRFLDDFPAVPIGNAWMDTTTAGFASDKKYVVETNTKVVERCMLMTTDPGDLVLDPTCGSGTTAVVAEEWGRRWITCDTSRVAVTLAKQRLMTASYPFYQLARPEEGVGSGFVYKTVPHVTLRSIAKNPELQESMSRKEIRALVAKYADDETLYDQPNPDSSKVRVAGPFTVEAVPAPGVRPITEIVVESQPAEMEEQPVLPGIGPLESQSKLQFTENVSVARYGETLRQRQWRDELLACGIRAKGGQRIDFSRLEPLGGTRWLQCEGETKGPKPEKVVASFGPEHAPLEQRQVSMALDEAQQLRPTPTMIIFATFQFDPEAAKDIDETKWPGVTLLKIQMNTDLLTDDLKKARSSNESYWLMGQPDVELRQVKKGEHKGKYEVEIHGFDYYNPRTGAIESGDTTKIALWMLDTDYDGRSIYPRQVFFPMAGPKDGWARLAKNLKAEIDEDLIEAYRGTVSLPFAPGDYRRAAVKIVDDRGIESLKVIAIE
jgi:adenine-specific DNA-methyltransferase